MPDVRELPERHPIRVFISKEEGWETQDVPFLDSTKEMWYEDRGKVWSDFWHVSERWVQLRDKFARTGDEKISGEMRQLEKDLRLMESAAGAASDEQRPTAPAPVPDEVGARRADKESRAAISL